MAPELRRRSLFRIHRRPSAPHLRHPTAPPEFRLQPVKKLQRSSWPPRPPNRYPLSLTANLSGRDNNLQISKFDFDLWRRAPPAARSSQLPCPKRQIATSPPKADAKESTPPTP